MGGFMTKYEYKYNPKHEKRYRTKGDLYVTPIERIICIIIINILIVFAPFCFIFIDYYLGFLICVFIVLLFICTQYNIFYNLERIMYLFYYLFGQKSIYKELITSFSQYENVVKYEKKLGISLRKSYLDCLKIIGKNSKHRLIIYRNYIKVDNIKYFYDVKEYKKIGELLDIIKKILIKSFIIKSIVRKIIGESVYENTTCRIRF